MNISSNVIRSSFGTYSKMLAGIKNDLIIEKKNSSVVSILNEENLDYSIRPESLDYDKELSMILSKYDSGMELSDEELKVLKKNSPETYNKAILAKAERERYRKELENCKSKEETMELKMKQGDKYLTSINNLKGNLETKSERLRIVVLERTINNEHYNFMQTDKYKGLPAVEEEDKKKHNKKIDIKDLNEVEQENLVDDLINEIKENNHEDIVSETLPKEGIKKNNIHKQEQN